MAYYEHDVLKRDQEIAFWKEFRIWWGKRKQYKNTPVVNIVQKHRKNLELADPLQNPPLVALLIAIAQAQQQALGPCRANIAVVRVPIPDTFFPRPPSPTANNFLSTPPVPAYI